VSDYSISATITADNAEFQKAITETINGLDGFGDAFADMSQETKQAFADLANQFSAIDAKSKVWGDDIDTVAEKKQALRAEINRLIDGGIAPESQQIQDLKRSYDSLGQSNDVAIDSFAKLRDVMQGPIAAAKMVIDGFKKVVETISKLSEEFAEDEVAAIRFAAAIEKSDNMTAGAATRLEILAKTLASTTGEANSAAEGQIAMLVATGRNEEQINKMIIAAKGLAVATGVDLDTALQQINATFSGTAGRLTKTTPALGDLSKAELENGDAVNILIDKYGDLSDALDNSSDVSMKNFKNALGEDMSAIGKLLEEYVKPLRNGMTEIFTAFADWANQGNNLKEAIEGIATGFLTVIGPMGNVISTFIKIVSAAGSIKIVFLEMQAVAITASRAILDYFSDFANNFITVINGLISGYNKIIAVIGGKPMKLIDKVDLADSANLNKKLIEINDSIRKEKEAIARLEIQQDKTSKSQQENLKDEKTLSEEAAKLALDWANKTLEKKTGYLEKEKEAALELARDKKASYKEVAEIASTYDKRILDSYKSSIEKQRAVALADAREKKADAATIANINAYYNDQILAKEIELKGERDKLEKDYTKTVEEENKKRTKETAQTAKDWLSAISTLSNALDGVLNEDISNFINGVTNIGMNIANVFETGGTSITAWAGLAASVISGVITLFSQTDRAAEVSARLAKEAADNAKEANDALTEVLRGGDSSYETYLGLKQAEEYLKGVTSSAVAASSSIKSYQDAWNSYYDYYYSEIMRQSKGTASVADAQAKAKASADRMASSWKMEADAANKSAAAMQYVYDTVYDGKIVTAETSAVMSEWADKLKEVVITYGETSTEVQALNEYYNTLVTRALYPMAAALDENNANLAKNAGLWKDATKATTAFQTQLSNLRNAASGIFESFGDIGTDIAESLVDGLSSGLDESGFMTSMKEYITKLVIQTAVYTDALTSRIAEIGAKIAAAMASGVDESGMSSIITELAGIYQSAAASAATVSGIVGAAFSGAGYASGTDSATRGWHMVGEQGPELAYFGGGERVLNAADTSRAVSNMTTNSRNVTVNAVFNSPKAMNQYEQMRAMKQYNRELSFRGI
jgi:hypothetical protein